MSPLLEKIKEQEVLLGMYDRRVDELEINLIEYKEKIKAQEENNTTSTVRLQGNVDMKLLDGMIDVVCRTSIKNEDIKTNNLTLVDLITITTKVAKNFLEYKRDVKEHQNEIEDLLDDEFENEFVAIDKISSKYAELSVLVKNIESEIDNDISMTIGNITSNIEELQNSLNYLTDH